MASQARYYASSSRGNDGDSNPPAQGQNSAQDAPSRVASAFGFQSLSGLFQQPTKSRYIRPQESEEPTPTPESETIVKDKPAPPPSDEGSFFQRNDPSQASGASENAGKHSKKKCNGTSVKAAVPEAAPSTRQPLSILRKTGRLKIRKFEAKAKQRLTPAIKREMAPLIRRGMTSLRRPNPFRAQRPSENTTGDRHQQIQKSSWGLSQEDQTSLDSIIEPGGSGQPSTTEQPPESELRKATSDSVQKPADQSQSALSHVNSSGEAHMVDVGAKASTKRIAIAGCHVHFLNPEPYKLIMADSNKKGDVLGVARIAGIMAAKRTSELIPLCHPLALTKISLDLTPFPPVERTYNKFGQVRIQTQVECTGPTGVEMEALTATNVAALTVYDMCKAVDKNLRIGSSSVTYKSGGKSGLFANEAWAVAMGKDFFVKKGLEVPACLDEGSKPLPRSQRRIMRKRWYGATGTQ